MKKRFLIAATALMLLAGAASCGNKNKSNSTDNTEQAAAAAAPVYEQLKSQSGKPVVVDFFATWCGPCTQFRPTFQAAEEKYKDKVEFRTIDVDQYGDLATQCRIDVIPTILFLDAEGHEISRFSGVMSSDQLSQTIDSLLATPAKNN